MDLAKLFLQCDFSPYVNTIRRIFGISSDDDDDSSLDKKDGDNHG